MRVWAPYAERVDVVVAGERRALARRDRGWFEADGDIAPGTDYAFSLDGGDRLPDPRSLHQPDGVHGPSRAVDHSAYVWTDGAWVPPELDDVVVYELHVGTFTPEGTFDAVTTRLDHLVDLGVNAVELMPVVEFPGARGWGYDGVDLFAPHHAYGGPDALKRLVDRCHGRGLAVILDVVYNHLGPAGNYLGRYGPYFTDRYKTPWGAAVNFDDAGSDEVRSFVIDNALMWLRDYHCDGLRLDAIHAIYDFSATHILEELATLVDELEAALGRRKWLIAESDLNDPRVVTERERGGYGIDAQWSDDFHHALYAVLTGESSGYYRDFGAIADLARALERAYVYAGRYSAYRDRRHGRDAAHLPGTRFVGYLQNHDQVGNRAIGDRSGSLMSRGLLEVGAALVLTSPFVPLLFQGEEWAASSPFLYFTDHADPELGRAVSEGRKNEFADFGWDPNEVPDPQEPATFERSKLDWAEIEKDDHAELLAWHKELIALRRTTPELRDGRLDRVGTRYHEDGRWLVIERGPVTIVCNLGSTQVDVPLDAARTSDLLLTSREATRTAEGVTLPPESVAIYRAG